MGSTATQKQSEFDRDALVRRLSVGQQKMATLPKSAVLRYLREDGNDVSISDEWPILQCQNIFILPGVPAFFERKIKCVAAHLPSTTSQGVEAIGLEVDNVLKHEKGTLSPSRVVPYRIVLSLDEDEIVSALNAAVDAHPHVCFGSYPIFDSAQNKTIITLEGRVHNRESRTMNSVSDGTCSIFSKAEMERSLETALYDLMSSLPEEGIVFIDRQDDLTTTTTK